MQATNPIKHANTCKIRYVYSTFGSISDGPSCFLSASSSGSSNSSSSVTSFTTYKKKINFMSRFISLGKYLHCVVSVIFSGRRTSTSRCPPSHSPTLSSITVSLTNLVRQSSPTVSELSSTAVLTSELFPADGMGQIYVPPLHFFTVTGIAMHSYTTSVLLLHQFLLFNNCDS